MIRGKSIHVFAAACALLLLAVLAACGGSASSPAATASVPPAAAPTPTPPATAPPTPPPPTTPPAPTPTPAKAAQFLYALGSTGMTETAFRVGSDGSLASLDTALQSSFTVSLTAADASGHHVFGFDASNSTGPLLTFSVDADSGALHQTSSAALPANATFTSKPVLNPAGTFMFAGLSVGQSGIATYMIATYSVDSAGNLSLVPAADGSAGNKVDLVPGALVVNPAGTFLYAALESHSVFTPTMLIQYAIDSAGRLTEVKSISVTSSDIGANALAMTPNGTTLYLRMFSPTVITFAVDPSTGNLTQKATAACACGNADEGGNILVNAKGTLLFEAVGGESFNDGGVALYGIDQSTGALTPLSNSFISIGAMSPPSFVLDSSGTFLYATGYLVNFEGFSVTDAGVVSTLPGSPFQQTAAQALFMVNFKT